MNRKYILIIIVLSITFSATAQYKKRVFLDAVLKPIDRTTYHKQLSSELFDEANIEMDTILYKKLRYRSFFGQLDPIKKSQLNKLFYNRHGIDTTKTWLIHHIDSLPNPKVMLPETKNELPDSITANKLAVLRKNKVANSERFYISRVMNRYGNNKNTVLLQFYNHKNGFPIDKVPGTWFKDESNILKIIFTDRVIPYSYIIIYPTGEFFAGTYRSDLKGLIKPKYFQKMKKIWIEENEKMMKNISEVQ